MLYLRSLREARLAHADDPFDPVEVALRRLDHAREWHRRGSHRLAVTEVAGVIDLGRAMGMTVDVATIERVDRLRGDALSTWPLDEREVVWSIGRGAELVAMMERLRAEPTAPVDATARRTIRVRATADDDVTDHCDESSATVMTALDQSSSER